MASQLENDPGRPQVPSLVTEMITPRGGGLPSCPGPDRTLNVVTNRGASPPPNQDRRAAIIYGAMAVVALIGLADSVYLAVEHDAGRIVRCTLLPGCADVLGSRYASVRGVPLALIGAIAYFVVFSLAILSAFGYRVTRQLLRLLVAGMLLTSLWLLYLQAFVLKAFCEHCLLSAAVTLGLSILALISRWRGRDDQTP